MQRLSLSASRSLLAARRSFASTTSKTTASTTNQQTPNVGTIIKRRKKPTPVAPGSPEAEQEFMSAPVSQEVSGEVFRNNMLLAAACVTFCTGVMWYSMHAVGQSGASADDPLAALKEEAAVAQAARDKESLQSNEASAMLKQFESGAFDPDQLDDEEEDVKPKKPWWKFW